MNEPLHPMTLAEVLDQTIHLYRRRFLVFFGIAVIPAGTVFVFAGGIFAFISWVGSSAKSGATVADVFIWLFLLLMLLLVAPLGLAVMSLASAAMTEAAARLFLGETITIRESYKSAWKRGWGYIGLYTLRGLIVVGVPCAIGFFALVALTVNTAVAGQRTAGADALRGVLIFLVVVLLALYALWMLLRLCLAFPACVVEQATATDAIKRSFTLSDGTRGRIFLLYLLGAVLNQMLALSVTLPAFLVIPFIPGLQGPQHARVVGMVGVLVTYGTYFAVKSLTEPVYGIALTLFYFDQRIRKEGFDIEWMMQKAGMVPAPAPSQVPSIEAAPWPTPDGIAPQPLIVPAIAEGPSSHVTLAPSHPEDA